MSKDSLTFLKERKEGGRERQQTESEKERETGETHGEIHRDTGRYWPGKQEIWVLGVLGNLFSLGFYFM